MPYTCKSCQTVVAVKPRQCPKCNQTNKGWSMQVAAPVQTEAKGKAYEFEDATATPVTAINVAADAGAIANQHGFPDADCLNLLLNATVLPQGDTKDKDSIYFTVIEANYGSLAKAVTKTKLLTNKSFAKTGKGASKCAELFMWDAIASSLTEARPYLCIGQTIRPCDLCTARYAALAVAKSKTILVYFDKGYDAREGKSWLAFTPNAPGGAWGPK